MSQNETSPNSSFWPEFPFEVPAGLGLLDEDFEIPEQQNQQSNNVQEGMISPTIQAQQPPIFPITRQPQNSQPSSSQPQISLTESNNVPPFLNDSYSSANPIDPYYNSPTQTYQPLTPMSPNSYPMHYPYYNPQMFGDPEYFAKFMAEEDKRRRNTAASARFRVKKKMREQALEKTAKDMSAKAELLEDKVKELEREIKWLKNLLIEKDSKLLDMKRPDDFSNNKDDGDKSNESDQQHQK